MAEKEGKKKNLTSCNSSGQRKRRQVGAPGLNRKHQRRCRGYEKERNWEKEIHTILGSGPGLQRRDMKTKKITCGNSTKKRIATLRIRTKTEKELNRTRNDIGDPPKNCSP